MHWQVNRQITLFHPKMTGHGNSERIHPVLLDTGNIPGSRTACMYATFPHVRRYYIYLLLPYTPSRQVLKITQLEMEHNILLSSMIQELQVLSFQHFLPILAVFDGFLIFSYSFISMASFQDDSLH